MPDENQALTQEMRYLYKMGGISALFTLIVLVLSILAYVIWPYAAGTTPLIDIFILTQENIFAAFTALDLGFWLINLVYIFIYLTLYFSLRKENEVYSFIALVIGLIGVVSLISTRPVFEIFALSDLYFSANTEAEKIQYLAAGEALIVQFHGSAWYISMCLTTASQLISSILMINSKIYGKAIAYIGIVTCSFGLAFWIPKIGIVLLFLSMLISIVWLILLIMNFNRLSKKYT